MTHAVRNLLLLFLAALTAAAELSAQTSKPERVAQAYLYVEPYQARFELLLDLGSVLEWLDPGAASGEELAPQLAAVLTQKAAAAGTTWLAVRADGHSFVPRLATARLVKGRPGQTLPRNEDEPILLKETMLGLIWEIPVEAHPQQMELTWQGFRSGLQDLPVTLFFGKHKESAGFSSGEPSLQWHNRERLPPARPLSPVPEAIQRRNLPLPLGTLIWLLGGLALGLLLRLKKKPLPIGPLPLLLAWVVGAVLTLRVWVLPLSLGQMAPPVETEEQAQAIVEPLLRNLYRAFDQRDETAIYRVIARSADDNLARELYLEIIGALSLDGQEGARVSVRDMGAEVKALEQRAEDGRFRARVNWSVLGTVGHWGHTHMRTAMTEGRITVGVVAGEWKLLEIEYLDQRRL